MNGFRSHSRDARVWRYQRAGGRAVSLEIREFWMEAAEAWRVAAQAAPPDRMAAVCPAES